MFNSPKKPSKNIIPKHKCSTWVKKSGQNKRLTSKYVDAKKLVGEETFPKHIMTAGLASYCSYAMAFDGNGN